MFRIDFFDFLLEIILMEGVFLVKFDRREKFVLRAVISVSLYFIVGLVLADLLNHWMINNSLVNAGYYYMTFGISLLVIKCLFQMEWNQILFVGTAGYAFQHMGFSIKNLLIEIFFPQYEYEQIEPVIAIVFYLIMAGVVYWFFGRKEQIFRVTKRADKKQVLISFTVLFFCIVLSIHIPYQQENIRMLFLMYSAICCGLGIAIQFDLLHQNLLEDSNEMLEQLLHMERQQHEMSKDTIEMINLKCHDLKYQIHALEAVTSEQLRKEKLEELKKDVMIYDCIMKTGNDTIDILLTEKSLVCQKYNIKLSYIIDGSAFDFMETTELYGMLGNALDNAIECVSKVPEDKRIISLTISKVEQMQFMHLENYCDHEIQFEDGLPVTTKEDKKYHGFGTKSISFIVKKYNGEMKMNVCDHKFSLDILFSA